MDRLPWPHRGEALREGALESDGLLDASDQREAIPAMRPRQPQCCSAALIVAAALAALATTVLALAASRRLVPGVEAVSEGFLEAKVQDIESKAVTCGSIEVNIDYPYERGVPIDQVPSQNQCCEKCSNVPFCQSWTWVRDADYGSGVYGQCWLKSGERTGPGIPKQNIVTGTMPPRERLQLVPTPQDGGFACGAGGVPGLPEPSSEHPSAEVRVLTYNLEWWKLFDTQGGWSAMELLKGAGTMDIMAFQECEDVHYFLNHAGLAGNYEMVQGPFAMAVAYLKSSWIVLGQGQVTVAEDKLGLVGHKKVARRGALWMRLHHVQSGNVVFLVNHHGPLPFQSGGMCGGGDVGYKLLLPIASNAQPGDVIILLGDFNANGGSYTAQYLVQRLNSLFAGTKDGGIDSFYSNLSAERVLEKKNLGGGGSDHDALALTLHLGKATA